MSDSSPAFSLSAPAQQGEHSQRSHHRRHVRLGDDGQVESLTDTVHGECSCQARCQVGRDEVPVHPVIESGCSRPIHQLVEAHCSGIRKIEGEGTAGSLEEIAAGTSDVQQVLDAVAGTGKRQG